jgi:hypothetical protein
MWPEAASGHHRAGERCRELGRVEGAARVRPGRRTYRPGGGERGGERTRATLVASDQHQYGPSPSLGPGAGIVNKAALANSECAGAYRSKNVWR